MFNEKALVWLPSYLSQRKKNSENTNDIKHLLEMDCGVPQRSGPLLFLIYVSDFYLASKLENVMFVDDTNVFILDENIGELLQQMNKELKSVSFWFKANKLSNDFDNWHFFIPLLKSVSCLKISRTVHCWHNSLKRNSN